MQTSFSIDHRPTGDGRHRVRLLLKLAGTPPDAGTRTPLNLAIVLDRSGSMAGTKLAAARDAAKELVRRLWPEDIASVVAYDDEVTTVAEPAAGGAQSELSTRIAAIGAGGSTNLSEGWLRGRELVAHNVGPGPFSRILLLTDGRAPRCQPHPHPPSAGSSGCWRENPALAMPARTAGAPRRRGVYR